MTDEMELRIIFELNHLYESGRGAAVFGTKLLQSLLQIS